MCDCTRPRIGPFDKSKIEHIERPLEFRGPLKTLPACSKCEDYGLVPDLASKSGELQKCDCQAGKVLDEELTAAGNCEL